MRRQSAIHNDFRDAYAKVLPAIIHRTCGKEEGETNHVKRWSCSLRQRVGRLARRALSFYHLDAIHLFATTCNLAIQQQATGR